MCLPAVFVLWGIQCEGGAASRLLLLLHSVRGASRLLLLLRHTTSKGYSMERGAGSLPRVPHTHPAARISSRVLRCQPRACALPISPCG